MLGLMEVLPAPVASTAACSRAAFPLRRDLTEVAIFAAGRRACLAAGRVARPGSGQTPLAQEPEQEMFRIDGGTA
jgi:hypothetical protein